MKREKFVCYDDTVLQSYLFEIEKPKGVVQIAHGMSEYSKTYFKFAEFLNKNGYNVFLMDQRAHGKSCEKLEEVGKAKGDIFSQILTDHLKASALLKEKYKKPLYFIGHSYGSFIGQAYLSKNQYAEKVILLGSAYMKKLLVWLGKVVASLTVLFKGSNAPARLVKKMSFDSYNKHFNDDASWITSDAKEAKSFYGDVLNTCTFSAGFYKNMFDSQLKLYKDVRKINSDLPIGIFSGEDDPVGEFGKGAKKLYNFYKKHGLNVYLKLYPKMRHGILQEKKCDVVYNDLLDFIKK
ncbi:MAG: alpha/beta fold hydrolase [Clostridia bacterium]|nr:alpha/beta fold hydrolase [Clostridia bacterium]